MLNEPLGFVERWARSAEGADERVLVDTGSDNGAVPFARSLGITVHEIKVDPWRFDVARNAAMALLPADTDVMVTLDVDEVLRPGWRAALEKAGPAAKYQYRYIWSHKMDGSPDVEFYGDRIVSRHGWMWRHPVHESLRWVGEGEPHTVLTDVVIEHLADNSKPRSQYLPLLRKAVEEAPNDDRMAHYYARELFFRGQWAEARKEFVRHLAMPEATWPPERAQSYRYLAKMDDRPERWLLHAASEDPNRREVWVDLMEFWLDRDSVMAALYARRALRIRNRPGDYMTEAKAWNDEWLHTVMGG